MSKTLTLCVLLVLASFVGGGCSGGGGLSLTGGSVPVGGRVVTGVALLPDGAAVGNSPVTVTALPSGTVLQTTTTDAVGKFMLTGISTSNDISVAVTQPPSNRLEIIVPRFALAANSQVPLDIGSVTALTTIVAACIHLEHGPAPEDSDSIVANQLPRLTTEVHDMDYSVEAQRQLIGDQNSLTSQALTLIVPAANTELAAFVAKPNTDTAETALNGLLGYVRAAHKREIHLDGGTRNRLIDAQLAHTVYSLDTIAAALRAAHINNVTAIQVSSASSREHTELTALPNTATGISPFEALVIAADIDTHGGFQIDQHPLEMFLGQLLR